MKNLTQFNAFGWLKTHSIFKDSVCWPQLVLGPALSQLHLNSWEICCCQIELYWARIFKSKLSFSDIHFSINWNLPILRFSTPKHFSGLMIFELLNFFWYHGTNKYFKFLWFWRGISVVPNSKNRAWNDIANKISMFYLHPMYLFGVFEKQDL